MLSGPEILLNVIYGIKHNFTRYLKESCDLVYDQHLFFKYLTEIALITLILIIMNGLNMNNSLIPEIPCAYSVLLGKTMVHNEVRLFNVNSFCYFQHGEQVNLKIYTDPTGRTLGTGQSCST